MANVVVVVDNNNDNDNENNRTVDFNSNVRVGIATDPLRQQRNRTTVQPFRQQQ